MDIECPIYTLRNFQFYCSLYSITNGQTFNVSVNFNGVLFQNYVLKDQNVTISYSFNNTGSVQVNALLPSTSGLCTNDGLNLTKIIQGKKYYLGIQLEKIINNEKCSLQNEKRNSYSVVFKIKIMKNLFILNHKKEIASVI